MAFASSVYRRMPSPVKKGVSAGSWPVYSYAAVNLRVAVLLASTSG